MLRMDCAGPAQESAGQRWRGSGGISDVRAPGPASDGRRLYARPHARTGRPGPSANAFSACDDRDGPCASCCRPCGGVAAWACQLLSGSSGRRCGSSPGAMLTASGHCDAAPGDRAVSATGRAASIDAPRLLVHLGLTLPHAPRTMTARFDPMPSKRRKSVGRAALRRAAADTDSPREAGIAQRQSTAFVKRGLWVQIPLPAPSEHLLQQPKTPGLHDGEPGVATTQSCAPHQIAGGAQSASTSSSRSMCRSVEGINSSQSSP